MSDRIRVLYVDDDVSSLEIRGDILEEEHGFDVHTATTVEDAKEELAGATVDCILSDYHMPDADGLEFLQHVREEYEELPFILFTSHESEELAREAFDLGVTDYFPKSLSRISYDLLAERIKHGVAQYRLVNQIEELLRVLRVTEIGEDDDIPENIQAAMQETVEEILEGEIDPEAAISSVPAPGSETEFDDLVHTTDEQTDSSDVSTAEPDLAELLGSEDLDEQIEALADATATPTDDVLAVIRDALVEHFQGLHGEGEAQSDVPESVAEQTDDILDQVESLSDAVDHETTSGSANIAEGFEEPSKSAEVDTEDDVLRLIHQAVIGYFQQILGGQTADDPATACETGDEEVAELITPEKFLAAAGIEIGESDDSDAIAAEADPASLQHRTERSEASAAEDGESPTGSEVESQESWADTVASLVEAELGMQETDVDARRSSARRRARARRARRRSVDENRGMDPRIGRRGRRQYTGRARAETVEGGTTVSERSTEPSAPVRRRTRHTARRTRERSHRRERTKTDTEEARPDDDGSETDTSESGPAPSQDRPAESAAASPDVEGAPSTAAKSNGDTAPEELEDFSKAELITIVKRLIANEEPAPEYPPESADPKTTTEQSDQSPTPESTDPAGVDTTESAPATDESTEEPDRSTKSDDVPVEPPDPVEPESPPASISEWGQTPDYERPSGLEFARGTSVLVQCSSQDPRRREACDDLLQSPDVKGWNKAIVRYNEMDGERLGRIADFANEVKVISVGYRQPVPTGYEDAIEVLQINNPNDLTRLGIVVSGILNQWKDDNHQALFCLDPLDVMLQYKSVQGVFRFLHILTGKLQEAGVMSHIHIDPTANDAQEVSVFNPLFDEVLTIDAGGTSLE